MYNPNWRFATFPLTAEFATYDLPPVDTVVDWMLAVGFKTGDTLPISFRPEQEAYRREITLGEALYLLRSNNAFRLFLTEECGAVITWRFTENVTPEKAAENERREAMQRALANMPTTGKAN